MKDVRSCLEDIGIHPSLPPAGRPRDREEVDPVVDPVGVLFERETKREDWECETN